jgi:DNA-binding Lrp family transcriptional regulator
LGSSLDDLDIDVLRGLYKGTSKAGVRGMFRGSFKGIAGELGLDEDTIRKRVKALQSTGLLTGWELYVSPGVLGCRIDFLWIDVDPKLDKAGVIRRISMVHGVVGITDMISQTIAVFIISRTEQSLRRSVGLITEISSGKILFRYGRNPSAGSSTLSSTDWKLIRALREKPTSSYKELGRAVGLTSRAAKRRMEKLIRADVITITPVVDFKQMKGAIAADMLVSYHDPAMKDGIDAKIASRIGRYGLRVGFGDEYHSHFTFVVPGIATVRDVEDWARKLNGIDAIKLDFIHDLIAFPDTYDELIPVGPN